MIDIQLKNSAFSGAILIAVLLSLVLIVPTLPLLSSKPINTHLLEDVHSKEALIFFGFRHCDNACPITLSILANAMDKLSAPLPSVIFVDIDSTSDNQSAKQFAQQFHPSFIGVHVTPLELGKLSDQFSLNIVQQNDLISHQGRTYLLTKRLVDKQPQWSLRTTFNINNLSLSELQSALESSAHQQQE